MTKTAHIAPIERFLLRTPLFSIDSLPRFYQLVEGNRSAFEDKELLLIEEAIYLASPDLLSEWQKWNNGHLKDSSKIRKLQISLLKYFKRMCTRCTPFGLFAGCSTGTIGAETDIVLKGPEFFKRHTRLDMHYTCALAQEMAKHPLIRQHIKYYPNNSVYTIGDETRYVDYRYVGKRRVHHISSIEANYYANLVMERARKGAYFNELVKYLMEEEVSEEDANAFVSDLLSIQLLRNDLEPSVTGVELVEQIAEILVQVKKRLNNADERKQIELLESRIEDLQAEVKNVDKGLGTTIDSYTILEKMVVALKIPYEKSKLLQTDLFTTTEHCTLDENTYQNVKEAISLLNRLSPTVPKANIKRFMERFKQRYDTAEVSLLEVLDVETGIGYLEGKRGDESPIVQKVPIMVRKGEQKLNWSNIHSFMLRRLTEASKKNQFEIKLTDKDFTSSDTNWKDTVDTVPAMIRHLGYRDGQPLVYMSSCGGSSAANLLGRFAHGDPKIYDLVKQITEREQDNNPDKLLAEVVHLPESRTGNILMRPVFRNYEIPYLAKASVDQEGSIDVSDLWVSIKKGKLILRSKSLNKEVQPHLSNAHNYKARALPVYHFLCDMQHYNRRTSFYFPFGQLQNEFKFFPRVSYKNVLISLASWKLLKSDYQDLVSAKDEDLIGVASEWQKKWQMPQHIVLVDGDNELYIDLHSRWSLIVFKQTIKKRGGIQLKEFGYDMDEPIVTNEKGQAFTNQMILVFERLLADTQSAPKAIQRSEKKILPTRRTDVQRDFSLGSEWLYYKIYCGTKTADRILTDFILPLTKSFEEQKWIDQWFFIRYGDPEKHLRLRLHFTDLKHMGNVIVQFNQAIAPWVEEKQVWSVMTDSYQREVERYDPAAIELSEKLFYYESKYIARFLELNAPYRSEETRWLFALKLTDALLSDFGLDLEAKEQFASTLKTSFAREFGSNKATRKSLASKYREHRKKIEQFLNSRVNGTPYHADVYQLIAEKSREAALTVDQINAAIISGETQITRHNLLYSYTHMLMNRVFRSNQRLHEMVLYDLLHTSYKSLLARQKKNIVTA